MKIQYCHAQEFHVKVELKNKKLVLQVCKMQSSTKGV